MINNNLKAQRQKFGVGSLLALLLLGAGFIGVTYFIITSTQVDSGWKQVNGKVTSISSSIDDGTTMYTPVISYTVNGQTHRVSSSFSSSSYPTVGDKKEVAYNPARPDQAKVVEGLDTTWLFWLFPLIGVILVVIAPISYMRSRKRSINIDALMQSGRRLQGVIVDIQSTRGQKNSTYTIVVAATRSDGIVQNFESDKISGIGGLALADFHSTPIPIDVYVDPTNPQNYYVDVSDIPNLTPERIAQLVQSVVKPQQQPQSILNVQQPQPPQTSNIDSQPPAPTV